MQPEASSAARATGSLAQRRAMVECQVQTFGVTHHGVIAAMLEVAREPFVDAAALAYSDAALACAGGTRLLLAPMILGRLLQAADLQPTDRVLDVAGGWGYSAAIIARLAGHVTTLESAEDVSAAARLKLREATIPTRTGTPACEIVCATGPLDGGVATAAPFDVVVVNGGIEVAPVALLAQLKEGGRLFAIDLSRGAPKAARYERTGIDISVRPLFEASAATLEVFRKHAAFVF